MPRSLPPGAPSAEDVRRAASRILPLVRRTPLEHSPALSARVGREVYLKLEPLQRTGSFKVRGAANAVAVWREEGRAERFVTASAGNHGLGAAAAARAAGLAATVFVPARAPLVKRRRIEALGAELRPVAGGYDEAHEAAAAHARSLGLPYLHAFSDPLVVAGQGTVALEILEDLPDVGSIVVPVGGGGLLGGVGCALTAAGRTVELIGVQSDATAAMHRSLEAGSPVRVPDVPTLCDGLAGDVDAPSLALAAAVGARTHLVSEAAVADAIRWLYVAEGVIAEGSAAVCVAAALTGHLRAAAEPVVLVVTGGNIDVAKLAALLETEPESR